MNETTPDTGALRTATLTLASSGPDDLSMEVTYEGAAEDATGIDRTSIAHNLIDHFAQQLIAGRDQLKARTEEADKPRLIVVGG